MELIITNRARLVKAYGEAGWKTIQLALNEYLDTLSSVGIDADLFLLEEIAPNADTYPKEFKNALQSLKHQHASKYVLLIGGHEVIPFYQRLDSTDDNILDHHILSDTYYVDFEESELEHWPEMAVGRIADGGSSDLLAAQLRRVTAAHRAGGISLSEARTGFSAEFWKSASKQTYFRLDKSFETLKFCPPFGDRVGTLTGVKEAINIEHLSRKGILFFNVHGHRERPLWWGGQRIYGIPDPRIPILVDYDTFSRADLSNSVLLCEACYGAAIHGRTVEESLALCAFKRGALAFFGSTSKCYAVTYREGKPSGVSGIDALFQALIHNLIVTKVRFGSALSDAKQQYSAYHNPYDEKNVLGLTLLGDPMLRFR